MTEIPGETRGEIPAETQPEAVRRWRAVDDARLCWRTWEEDSDPLTVLYHLGSDDTHLLNAFGVSVIRALQRRTCSVAELEHELSEEFFGNRSAPLPVERRDLEAFLRTLTVAGILEEIA